MDSRQRRVISMTMLGPKGEDRQSYEFKPRSLGEMIDDLPENKKLQEYADAKWQEILTKAEKVSPEEVKNIREFYHPMMGKNPGAGILAMVTMAQRSFPAHEDSETCKQFQTLVRLFVAKTVANPSYQKMFKEMAEKAIWVRDHYDELVGREKFQAMFATANKMAESVGAAKPFDLDLTSATTPVPAPAPAPAPAPVSDDTAADTSEPAASATDPTLPAPDPALD